MEEDPLLITYGEIRIGEHSEGQRSNWTEKQESVIK